MGRKKRIEADHRADTKGGRWVGIPYVVIDSEAYAGLGLWARAVLVEVVRRFDGYNNGHIAISQREIAQRLRTSNFGRISKAVAELMQAGFLDVASDGQWKQRQAREYRLTFVTTTGRPATNDYLRNDPPSQKSGDEPVSAETAKSAEPVSAAPPFPAEPVSADSASRPPVGVNGSAEPVSSLIVSHPRPLKTGEQTTLLETPHTGRPSQTRCCEQCEEPFMLDRIDRAHPRRFCSERCRKAAERKRAAERKTAA